MIWLIILEVAGGLTTIVGVLLHHHDKMKRIDTWVRNGNWQARWHERIMDEELEDGTTP